MSAARSAADVLSTAGSFGASGCGRLTKGAETTITIRRGRRPPGAGDLCRHGSRAVGGGLARPDAHRGDEDRGAGGAGELRQR
ncbi:MAG TPA: hypothetical protein VK039_10590, partial [Brevibacterium sp.]|nr:hypothetical protein [Brevibacterium sp.]